jgi:protein-L-isoaspartate O-methyltransferase
MFGDYKDNLAERLMAGVYGLAVFLSAFLLFAVQPLIGKYILPWFGGSPEVWTMCMLCFQVLLLAGYAYAHLNISKTPRWLGASLHIALLLAALALLPIVPSAALKPAGTDNAMLGVLLTIVVSVGVPFFVLAATGPLIQAWYTATRKGKEPYRLYSLSNAGSLIALLSYPFLIEPAFTRADQARFWGWGLALFAIICAACALWYWKRAAKQSLPPCATNFARTPAAGSTRTLWVALPFGASVMLLAVTNQISQDIAVVPIFWVGPLSLYLLSFIICFHHERWYVRNFWVCAFVAAMVSMLAVRFYIETVGTGWYIAAMGFLLFCSCMVCHGELYKLRPTPSRLTEYYLLIAVGGALGGIFVGVVAPLIFNAYSELYLGVAACVLFVLLTDDRKLLMRSVRMRIWAGTLLACATVAIFFHASQFGLYTRALANTRNFFGVLTITEADPDDPQMHRFIMKHGTTFHGLQFVDDQKSRQPTAYYGKSSGVALAIAALADKDNLRIGAVGLGVGTIATYLRSGGYLRFYEINPEVERLARKYFSYLGRCAGEVDVAIGDARVSMEGQEPQNYDILVLDAFTGDAIPVHLLTKEAFEVYLRHLKPGGIIAAHISSIYLDLRNVVYKAAQESDLKSVWVGTQERPRDGVLASEWVLLAPDDAVLSRDTILTATHPLKGTKDLRLWTDDYVNIFEALR